MNTSFVQRLRMNNLYGDPGSPPQNPLGPLTNTGINMDEVRNLMDMYHGYKQQDADAEHQRNIELLKLQMGGKLQDISAQVAGQEQVANTKSAPKNVVFKDDKSKETDYQKGELALGGQKLAQAGKLGEEKLTQGSETARGRQDVAQQRANTYGQQGANRMEQINAQGDNARELVGIRGDIQGKNIGLRGDNQINNTTLLGKNRLEQIGAQGDNQMNVVGAQNQNKTDLQSTRGTQALADIAARAAANESRDTNKINLTPTKPISASQTKVGQGNAAAELANTRPDLAPFISYNADTKTYNIVGKPSPDQARELKAKIYGSDAPQGDVELPPDNPKVASAPVTRKRVKGPNGESGTIPADSKLPDGWSEVQ